jgi:hypothetical protein
MKKLILSLLSTVTILTPGVAKAENTYEDHVSLWNTLGKLGVVTVINNKIHCTGEYAGSYFPYSGLFVVCQENGISGGPQVEWTKNDLDTLRHEAHHVIQDCVDGSLGDGKSSTMFNHEELIEFGIKSSWTEKELSKLIDNLKGQDLSNNEILEEVEAYIVASDIPVTLIEKKVVEFCTN